MSFKIRGCFEYLMREVSHWYPLVSRKVLHFSMQGFFISWIFSVTLNVDTVGLFGIFYHLLNIVWNAFEGVCFS